MAAVRRLSKTDQAKVKKIRGAKGVGAAVAAAEARGEGSGRTAAKYRPLFPPVEVPATRGGPLYASVDRTTSRPARTRSKAS